MRPETSFRSPQNWLQIGQMVMTSQFANMMLYSFFFKVALFLYLGLVTVPKFMSISSLVLEL